LDFLTLLIHWGIRWLSGFLIYFTFNNWCILLFTWLLNSRLLFSLFFGFDLLFFSNNQREFTWWVLFRILDDFFVECFGFRHCLLKKYYNINKSKI
jgi:hypothetical protein